MGGKNRLKYFHVPTAHTEYTRMVAEHGLLGLVSLVVLGAMAVRSVREQRTRQGKAISVAFLTYALLLHDGERDAVRGPVLCLRSLQRDAGRCQTERARGGATPPARARRGAGGAVSRPAAAGQTQAFVRTRPPGLLMVGNFLSGAGGRRGVCEDLAIAPPGLGLDGPDDLRSPRTRPPRREHAAVCLVLAARILDLPGGRRTAGSAFLWAAAVTRLLQLLGKPYVLSLHGGNLAGVRAPMAPAGSLRPRFCQGGHRTLGIPGAGDEGVSPRSAAASESAGREPGTRFRFASQPRARLVWLRAFHETYNPSLAPAVLALLARDNPDVSLTMIGPDKGDGSLQRALAVAAQLGVGDRLRVVGGVPKEEVGRFCRRPTSFSTRRTWTMRR